MKGATQVDENGMKEYKVTITKSGKLTVAAANEDEAFNLALAQADGATFKLRGVSVIELIAAHRVAGKAAIIHPPSPPRPLYHRYSICGKEFKGGNGLIGHKRFGHHQISVGILAEERIFPAAGTYAAQAAQKEAT